MLWARALLSSATERTARLEPQNHAGANPGHLCRASSVPRRARPQRSPLFWATSLLLASLTLGRAGHSAKTLEARHALDAGRPDRALEASAIIRRWEQEEAPTVAVLPFRNETSEHVDSALEALISDVETTLINAGHVRVISLERQGELMAEIRKQQGDGFDAGQVSRWGQQLGARYLVTGKVFTTDERLKKERRVQYYMFLQILEVETGQIVFQNKSAVTKAML